MSVSVSDDQIIKFCSQFQTDKQYFKFWVNRREYDPLLLLLSLLKDNWSLTESGLSSSDIKFSTGWYNSSIQMPQITITPASSRKFLLTVGDKPLYQFQDTILINIWVRPKQDSNTSLGWAKHAEYEIRQEVERILRSGSRLPTKTTKEQFMYLGRWRTLDETDKRPVLLRSQLEVKDNYFRSEYEEA